MERKEQGRQSVVMERWRGSIKLNEIVIDPLLKHREVDDHTRGRYVHLLRAGQQFASLILVEAGTNRLLGGHHRVPAYRQVYGAEAEVACEFVTGFASELEAFEFAVQDNMAHGRQLTGFERGLVLARMLRLGADKARIAQLLGVVPEQLEQMGERMVIVSGRRPQPEGGEAGHKEGSTMVALAGVSEAELAAGVRLPIKRDLHHKANERMSVADYVAHCNNGTGVQARLHGTALLNLLAKGWLEREDEGTRAVLVRLQQALADWLKEGAA